MPTFEDKLEQYADLIVKIGVNVQSGQIAVVSCTVENAALARMIVRKAYEAGASNVHVDWRDDELTLLKYKMADEEVFQVFPEWEAAKRDEFVDKRAAFIYIDSPNPGLLKDVDVKRIGAYQKAAGKALSKYREGTVKNWFSWVMAAAPSREWAKKVFPNAANENEAIKQLWEAIFAAVRLDETDPVHAWKEHDAFLHAMVQDLNRMQLCKLHYRAPGTALTVELPERHVWTGASSVNDQGIVFMPNMPTEEVFTSPRKDGVNGYVTSTKPLNYGGTLIENFRLTFDQGRIVEANAERGEAMLLELIHSDEGAHYLGEVALVPQDSPISRTNVLFYNTLFDENASNHLAIGAAFPFCIENGTTMTKEELDKLGLNDSSTHVDFMIGSPEMDIDGELEDGSMVPIFRNGNWAK